MKNAILCIGDEEEEDPFHVFSVREFNVRERMNAVFEVNLMVVSPFEDLDFGDIVGLEASFSLSNSIGIWRGYSGIIRRLEQVRIEAAGLNHYAVTLVPHFWQLSQRRNYRVFQHQTTQEIINAILDEWHIEYEWYLDRQDYPKHEYKVQYGETDLAFIDRLLEEAGISYYFWDDPADDDVKSHLQFDDTPQTSDLRNGIPIPYTDNPSESQGGGEYVTEVTLMHDVRPGTATIRDFDFRRRPDAQLFGTTDPFPAPEDALEIYAYDPNGFLFDTDKADPNTPIADDKSKARSLDREGDNQAEILLEQLRVGKRHVTYRSSCHDLSPGIRFEMEHPREDLGLEDLLSIEAQIFGKHDGEWVLRGHAVFADDVYRPVARTPKPIVQGMQTAIVVGPPGEEIYTDEFGRVRVRFMWDREGEFDDNRTCWLRVAQDWAGGAFGGQRIPRIDQEVIVNFLEGDPDNPIIVGRLYNNTNKVPYQLPKRKVVSTIKSDSSPHSGGFNEVMFDDTAAKEYVYIQAEKDLWKLVKNDEVETTGNDRKIQIAQNQNTTIGNVDSTSAGTTHDVSVGSTRIQKFDKLITITVGDSTFTLDGPNISVVAKSDMIFSALGDFVIQGGPNVRINCEDTCDQLWDQYKKEAQDLIANAGDDVRLRNKIISGAYADLYLKNSKFKWAGLAAYASKQVGCAMDYAKKMSRMGQAAGPLGMAVEFPADYTLDALGKGNKDLFLDVYPMHRFYQEQGPEAFAKCASSLPDYAQKGFQAITDGNAGESLKQIANHEQIDVLQKEIYNDATFQKILRVNQTGLPMTSPAALTLSSGCDESSGPTTKFQGTQLYDVPERMDWILNQAAPMYDGVEGTPQHVGDLGAIKNQGAEAGAQYP